MKKSDPKLIVNLNLSSPELVEKIEFAIDEYIDSIIESKLSDRVNEKIKRYIEDKLDAVVLEKRWDNECLVDGQFLSTYVTNKVRPKVENIIEQLIQQVIANKLRETVFNAANNTKS